MPILNSLLPIPKMELASVRFVRFEVVDPYTYLPLKNVEITLLDHAGKHSVTSFQPNIHSAFDLASWRAVKGFSASHAYQIDLIPGETLSIAAPPSADGQPPPANFYIVVKASLFRRNATNGAATVGRRQIQQLGAAATIQNITKTDAGVATDSSGQEHIRGEHAEITYVVDGIPLPDTLSGRQGAIVVPSTIQSLSLLTGAYAPEYGGQTAGIMDITTLPGARHFQADYDPQIGSYSTTNGDLSAVGPIGKTGDYVLDLGATRTLNAEDPQQPDHQTAHNAGASLNQFAKFRVRPTSRDSLSLTLSSSPDTMQLNNRTGLPSSFALAGEGFGFLGYRDQNGNMAPTAVLNPGGLGDQNIPLLSQQALGMDITQREADEFLTLAWQHKMKKRDSSMLSVTLLHAGQDVNNHNPSINLQNLPVDNSIEYNPTVSRNVHHVQIYGDVNLPRGKHTIKAGILLDDQLGDESYQLTPASQLALDELFAVDPNLAPSGTVQTQGGKPVTDALGNPIYQTHAAAAPILQVHRAGFYRAAYAQDTWKESNRFTINYGLRADWYRQSQSLGQPIIDTLALSPRFNFAYSPDRRTSVRWSVDRLFNTPPLAQGSVVGAPIQPEILTQYDLSVQRLIGKGQNLELAYYVKDIRNQVDTGLIVPGVQIGVYSAVNFQIGGVHGIEFSYDSEPTNGVGMNSFLNYSYSIASPAGLDNAGQPAPIFNDHDQRNTVGGGIGYSWKSGANSSLTFTYGSGLASSPVPPSALRIPNSEFDLHFGTGSHALGRFGAVNLDILNLFDSRDVVNFESGFSGTRFQQGRRILLSIVGKFR